MSRRRWVTHGRMSDAPAAAGHSALTLTGNTSAFDCCGLGKPEKRSFDFAALKFFFHCFFACSSPAIGCNVQPESLGQR
jgi:hypothetical protein